MRKQKADDFRLEQVAKDLVPVQAATQMADDYCTYANTVNLGRAIPHVNDGLKPVQRRVMYAMHDLGLAWDKPFKKCARIDGDTTGKYSPHGCLAYDTKVVLMDGTTEQIGKLAEAGEDRWVLSWDTTEQKHIAKAARHFRVGKTATTEYRIKLVGYAEDIVCTDNHKFFADGKWTRADQLAAGQSLLSAEVAEERGYPVVATQLTKTAMHLAYGYEYTGLQVHHLDEVKSNNDLSNLLLLTGKQHAWFHSNSAPALTGLAKGRAVMQGRLANANAKKNSALITAVNAKLPEIKAHKVVQKLLQLDMPLTWESYHAVANSELLRPCKRAPKADTLLSKGLSLRKLIDKPVVDTSSAVGFFPVNSNRLTKRTGATAGTSLTNQALDQLAQGRIGQAKCLTLDTLLRATACDTLAEIHAKFAGRWFGVVESVTAHQVESTAYYDCSVDDTECFFIEVDGKLVLTHNSAYGTLVNLATTFGNRYNLIDGQGNFGSTSDGAAAARYTEARPSRFGQAVLLEHLDSAWVEHKPNYDGSLLEPVVLPARVPMLLLRDTAGIGVAAACSHVSYNLSEVISLSKAAIQSNGTLRPEQGLEHITMPDFAMGAQVLIDESMTNAIMHGHGCVRQFARMTFDEASHSIICTELPQDVSPEAVLNATYAKVKDGHFTRAVLRDARDESDRSGTRVVWELNPKAWHMAPWLMRELYKHTNLKTTTSVNAVSVNADSKSYSCKGVAEVANEWAKHRIKYETAKLQHQCLQLEQRDELLQGMLIALEHIIAVAQALIDGRELSTLELGLTDRQISAIEAMPLRSLRSKNRDKLRAEVDQTAKDLAWRRKVLSKPQNMVKHICRDLDDLNSAFGDARRTTAYVEPPEFAEAEAIAAKLSAEAEANRTYGWLLDNRAEGKEHTYYRISKQLRRLPGYEIKANSELGVAAILSNGAMYWMPANRMAIDAPVADSIKQRLADYIGKPFEPGVRVVWSEIIDRANPEHLKRELVLIGRVWNKPNSVCKRISLSELTQLTPRKKHGWLAVLDAIVLEVPANGGWDSVVTVEYESGDRVAMDLAKQVPTMPWPKNAALMRAGDKAKAVASGNTTGRKKLGNRKS